MVNRDAETCSINSVVVFSVGLTSSAVVVTYRPELRDAFERGGDGFDELRLFGDYSGGVTFDPGTMVNVERIVLMGGPLVGHRVGAEELRKRALEIGAASGQPLHGPRD